MLSLEELDFKVGLTFPFPFWLEMPIYNAYQKQRFEALQESWIGVENGTMLPNKRGTNFETKFLWVMHMLRANYDLGPLNSIPKPHFQMCVISTQGGLRAQGRCCRRQA